MGTPGPSSNWLHPEAVPAAVLAGIARPLRRRRLRSWTARSAVEETAPSRHHFRPCNKWLASSPTSPAGRPLDVRTADRSPSFRNCRQFEYLNTFEGEDPIDRFFTFAELQHLVQRRTQLVYMASAMNISSKSPVLALVETELDGRFDQFKGKPRLTGNRTGKSH